MSRPSSRRGAASRSSTARGRGASARRPQSSNNAGPVLATIVVLAVVIGGIVLIAGGKGPSVPSGGGSGKQQAQRQQPSGNSASSSKRPSGSSRGAGKIAPDRPAPSVDESKLAEARKLYDQAKEDYNAALTLQKAGKDKPRFLKLMGSCKDKIQEACALMEPVMLWYEEADLSNWRMPQHIEDVNNEIGRWLKLETRAHKVSYGH